MTCLARIPPRPLMMAGPKQVAHENRFQRLVEEEIEEVEAPRPEKSFLECAVVVDPRAQKKRKAEAKKPQA